MKPRALLDCDGVLGDFLGTLLADAEDFATREQLGLRTFPKLSSITNWELRKHLDPAQYKLAMKLVDTTPFARDMDLMPGAQEAVAALRKQAEIFVVTSPWVDNKTWEFDRRSWLKTHFDVDEDHVVSTTVKFLISGDVLVDDRPKHIQAWQHANSKLPILFAQPHNQAYREDSLHRTISHWDEAAVDLILKTAMENRR